MRDWSLKVDGFARPVKQMSVETLFDTIALHRAFQDAEAQAWRDLDALIKEHYVVLTPYKVDEAPDDDTLMTFGKYRGKKLSEVPASYYHFLWSNGLKNEPEKPIHQYIKKSMSALKLEHPDGIWT